jgi:polyferredoxin
MSLIKCPACRKQVSDKVEICPHCEFSFKQSEDEIQKMKVLKYRTYRDKMYRLKMYTFFTIAIAVIGTVPMIWNYAKAIDYGFNANILNHWGIYFVIAGFVMYVIIRVMMLNTKKKYKASK